MPKLARLLNSKAASFRAYQRKIPIRGTITWLIHQSRHSDQHSDRDHRAGIASRVGGTRIMKTDGETPALSFARRVAILVCVVLTVTLYFTTLMIASTVLPQIQGGLSATADEVSWVMTFNLLATAVGTPTAGWLVARFGRRNVMVTCMGLFTVATLGCAMSDSLSVLIFWRIVQGATGAPTVPIAQSILLDAFPKRQHRMALGCFGMAS